MKKILIYDDERRFGSYMRESLLKLPAVSNEFEVDLFLEADFSGEMQELKDRQLSLRSGSSRDFPSIAIDSTSIFIVDFDLAASSAGLSLTSNSVAYLARCFSSCGLIIGVNLVRGNRFDLSLRGNPESFADINVSEKQLANPNLWGSRRAGFRPWHWPRLPDYLRDFEKRVEDIKAVLGKSVPLYEVLGFSKAQFGLLPKSVSRFLGREPIAASVDEFIYESGNGLRPKDQAGLNDDVLARIGASRLSKWLERMVLPGQDILVDGPHLVSRFPSLLTHDRAKLATWNAVATLSESALQNINVELIADHRISKDHWLSRPAWFWYDLRENQSIEDVSQPWKTPRPRWVFCEDASRFYQRSQTKSFVFETESPFARRFIRQFKEVEYSPAVYLSARSAQAE